MTAMTAGVFECSDYYPLHAPAGVDFLLNCNLVGASLLEVSAHKAVEPLGVFANDHEIHVPRAPAFQRAQPVVEHLDGPEVYVEVEPGPDPEQDIGGVLVIGNSWVTKRSGQDGIILRREHLQCPLRQADLCG